MHFSLPSATAIAFSAAVLLLPAGAGADDLPIISRALKGERLNELAAWNLGTDKAFEIFFTSVAGKAGCYTADSLEPVWEKKVTNDAITAPAIGKFLGSGAPVLGFASLSGEIFFLWPGSGEIISSVKTDLSFSQAPSVAEMPDRDALVLADEQGRIAVAALDPQTGTAQLLHIISNTLPGTTAFSVVGAINQPPTCADLNGDGQPEIIVTSNSGVLQVISLPSAEAMRNPGTAADPARYHTRLAQQSQATTIVAAGPLSHAEQRLIALGVEASLHFFSWDPTQKADKAIQPALQAPAFGSSLGHLLIGQVNSDAVPDLLSTANNTVAARYLGSDLAGGQTFLDIAPRHLTTSAPPFSPAVAYTKADGAKAVLAVDQDGVAWEWLPVSAENTMTRITDVPVPTGYMAAGDLKGDGKLCLAIWDQKRFTLSVVSLPIDLAQSPHAAPFLTAGVNFSRDGQWGDAWAARWQEKLAAAAVALQQGRATLENTPDDSEATTDPVSVIAGLDPKDPIAEHFRKKHEASSLTSIGVLVATIVLILGGAGMAMWKLRRH